MHFQLSLIQAFTVFCLSCVVEYLQDDLDRSNQKITYVDLADSWIKIKKLLPLVVQT